MAKDFWDTIKRIRECDDRLDPEFYPFVMEALDYTLQQIGMRRHVSARELLDGLCGHARSRFGLLAGDVLGKWGVTSPEDVGRAVFQLVDSGILKRQDSDRPEDFEVNYDLRKRIEENYFE